MKFAYSLFLTNILITCELLIIATPCYLSNWNMWYNGMIWTLLFYMKNLGFVFKIQNSNSMLLNDMTIPTRAISSISSSKPSHICYLFLHWVLSSLVDPCWASYHAPKIKITYTHIYISYSYTGNTLKYASIHHKSSTPTLGVDKNMS